MINKIYIMGRLTRDPETSTTPKGTGVCTMSVAVNAVTRDPEQVCYFDVVAWAKTGENCAKFLGKGDEVFIEGYMRQERWTDKQTGQNRSRMWLVAQNVQFLRKAGSAENNSQSAPSSATPETARNGGVSPRNSSNATPAQSQYHPSPFGPKNTQQASQASANTPPRRENVQAAGESAEGSADGVPGLGEIPF